MVRPERSKTMHIAYRTNLAAPSPTGRASPPIRYFEWLELCILRSRERRHLRELTDRELKDVGLSAADVARECRRWPWDGPPRRF
jgi:uncharacterized protein YjiS (DUF1127 family)